MKTVLMPIEVPEGALCWDAANHVLCSHFDNEGGHNSCELGFWEPKDVRKGVAKPSKCLELETKCK